MNDPRVLITIIVAVAVIIVFIIMQKRITRFRGSVGKGGGKVEVGAAEPYVPPAPGVDLSRAQFKDKNKFEAGAEARVKAPEMRAGTGNEFRFGGTTGSRDERKTE